MVNQRGGAGGYGAIWTLSQEQRQGRYEPHITISRHLDYDAMVYHVKCLDCGEEWQHHQNDRWFPPECTKRRAKAYEEDLKPKLKVEVED